MQPTEGMSIQRRSLDVEDYIDIMRRHKGWIFGPFLFTLVVSVVGAYMWPDSYTSTAIIRIVPQQVPEEMVQAAVSQRMEQRMSAMMQTVESRSVLSNIINTYNLYPKLRNQEPIEDVIEEMKSKDIHIAQITNFAGSTGERRTSPAYSISFSYDNRYLAQKVVGDLEGRFLEESIRNKGQGTYATTEFMKEQRDQAEKELNEVEVKLQAFQTQNNGRLPDQMDANMRQLQALQMQQTNIGSQISRATQDRLQLQGQIQIFKDQQASVAKEQPIEQQNRESQKKNMELADAENTVKAAETQLNILLQRYKEDWPDVQAAKGRLAIAKQLRDDLLKEDEKAKKAEPAAAPVKVQDPMKARELRDLDARVRQLQTNVEAKDMEIASLNKELSKISEQTKLYMGRVETMPAGTREYGDLLREQAIAKAKYVSLDQNLQKAQIAQDMENRKQGETLELLDPPSLPQNPTEPKRYLIVSIGAAIGLLLGIVIAGALEMKDTSLKNLKDVRAYTQMAILGSIPLLENDFVVRRRKRLAWLGWTTASLVGVVIMSGSVVYYYVTKV